MVPNRLGPENYFFGLVVFFSGSDSFEAGVSEGLAATGISPTSNGSGAGVVAIVYPIHAIMARITVTPKMAVSCNIKVVILTL